MSSWPQLYRRRIQADLLATDQEHQFARWADEPCVRQDTDLPILRIVSYRREATLANSNANAAVQCRALFSPLVCALPHKAQGRAEGQQRVKGVSGAVFHQTLECDPAVAFDWCRTVGFAIDIDMDKKTLGGGCGLVIAE